MLSPDDPDARFLVTAIVRDIAAGTGLHQYRQDRRERARPVCGQHRLPSRHRPRLRTVSGRHNRRRAPRPVVAARVGVRAHPARPRHRLHQARHARHDHAHRRPQSAGRPRHPSQGRRGPDRLHAAPDGHPAGATARRASVPLRRTRPDAQHVPTSRPVNGWTPPRRAATAAARTAEPGSDPASGEETTMQPSTPRLDDTPCRQWRDIFTNPHHTGQTWACVAVAIAHADEVVRHAARAP